MKPVTPRSFFTGIVSFWFFAALCGVISFFCWKNLMTGQPMRYKENMPGAMSSGTSALLYVFFGVLWGAFAVLLFGMGVGSILKYRKSNKAKPS